jgi:hypothetical protein
MIATGSADAAAQLKAIVLVHGAFADGSSWDRVVASVTCARSSLTGWFECGVNRSA